MSDIKAMLSEELIKLSENLGRKDQLAEIVHLLEEYDHFFLNKTSLSKELEDCTDPIKLFGYNALRYIQLLLYRSKTLSEGSIHSLNNNCALTSLLSVRAHYETTGGVFFFLRRLSSYYDGNIDFERINSDLKKLSLGSTTIDHPDVPEPIQAMKLIDATDHYLKKNLSKEKLFSEKLFRKFYGDLSEFCHPNYPGIMSGCEIIHDEKSISYNKTGRITEPELRFFFHLEMSIRLFVHGYKEVIRLIKDKEIMPILHEK